MIFIHNGKEEEVFVDDFASINFIKAARYLESAAYAICPDNSSEGHIGVRVELEHFLATALRTGELIDGLRGQNCSADEIKNSEPVHHNLKYLKTEQAPHLVEVMRAYDVGHSGEALDRSKMLADFVVRGTCALLGGLLGASSEAALLGFRLSGENFSSRPVDRTAQLSGIAKVAVAYREKEVVGPIAVMQSNILAFH